MNMNDMNNLTNFNDLGVLPIIIGLIFLIISIIGILEIWIIFKKCGKKGWLSIIPIAQMWTLFQIVDLPGWLSLIPVANLVGTLLACFKLPKKFGKSSAFGIGILFLPFIFLGILAFSKSETNKEEKKDENVSSFENAESNASTVLTQNENTIGTNPDTASVKNENQTNSVPDLMAPPTIEEKSVAEAPDSVNKMEEAPALNLEEPKEPSMPLAPEISTVPITSQASETVVPEKEEVNAFNMPSPVNQEVVINNTFSSNSTLENTNNAIDTLTIETTTENNLSNIETIDSSFKVENSDTNIFDNPEPVQEDVLNITEPETPASNNITNNEKQSESIFEPNINSMDDLEATFELPKMANEIINSDIKETKTCPKCNHVNEYSNKVCSMCGTNLE